MLCRTSCLIVVLCAVGVCIAQQPCSVDIPVNVILPNGGLVRKLGPQAFVVHTKDSTIPVASVSDESGPRRILLVVESGGRLRKVSREAAHIFLSELLANARAQDSFALLTTKGPRIEVPFSAPRDELLAAVDSLRNPPKANTQPDIDDVIPQAVGRFKQPMPGDAIILITMGIDDERNAPHTGEANALAESRVRLFGLQLGRFYSAFYVPNFANELRSLHGGSNLSLNLGNLTGVAEDSGGFAFYENTEGAPTIQYQLTEERKQELKRLAGQLYKGIIEFYVVRVDSAAPEFQLSLAEPIRKDLPQVRIVYPRRLAKCSPP